MLALTLTAGGARRTLARRVFEIAKDLGVNHRDLLSRCDELGIQVRNYMSVLSDDAEETLRAAYSRGSAGQPSADVVSVPESREVQGEGPEGLQSNGPNPERAETFSSSKKTNRAHQPEPQSKASTDRPSSIDDYRSWAEQHLQHDFSRRTANHYETASKLAKEEWETCTFMSAIGSVLSEAADDYYQSRGVKLFSAETVPTPEWHVKPFTSIVDKLYRQNVVWNRRFPKEPKNGGWIGPQDVLGGFNDIVRSRLVLRYMDGPEFLARRISSAAEEAGITCEYDSRELDDGYYAFHVYLTQPITVPDIAWDNVTIESTIELQLTTQLQDVLRDLTHRLYESRRLEHNADRKKWKWDHRSGAFHGAYLAHALHLIEGMLLNQLDRHRSEPQDGGGEN